MDKQDEGEPLTDSDRREAEGLVDLADLLSLLRLRAERVSAGPHAGFQKTGSRMARWAR
jgi:hypothetical protein